MQTTDVRDVAQNAVNQGKSFLEKQVDERTNLIGEQIGTVAKELRTVGSHLRESGPVGIAAGYVDQAADMIDQLGRYLQDADSDRLMGDLENIARANPWGIAAGALVIGFAASRFLKSSSARRYRELDETYGTDYRGRQADLDATRSTYGEMRYGRAGSDPYAT